MGNRRIGRSGPDREDHAEDSPFRSAGVQEFYVAAVLHGDLPSYRQSQSRPLADILCREERIENPVPYGKRGRPDPSPKP